MDDLSDRYAQANEEYHKLNEWYVNEMKKIFETLPSAGLDTNREAYAGINAEHKRRLLDLFDKYKLPNKPNI